MSWLAHLASCKRETLRSIERRIFWWIFPFNLTLSRQLHLFPKRPFQWCKFSTCPPFLSVLFTGNLHIIWHTWQGAGEKKGSKVHFLASVRSIQKISNSCHGIKSWHEQAVFDVTDVWYLFPHKTDNDELETRKDDTIGAGTDQWWRHHSIHRCHIWAQQLPIHSWQNDPLFQVTNTSEFSLLSDWRWNPLPEHFEIYEFSKSQFTYFKHRDPIQTNQNMKLFQFQWDLCTFNTLLLKFWFCPVHKMHPNLTEYHTLKVSNCQSVS